MGKEEYCNKEVDSADDKKKQSDLETAIVDGIVITKAG